MPMPLSSLAHISMLALMPAEPCWRTTTGSRPVPFVIRSCPVIVVGFPLASPDKNCASDKVRVSIEYSSVRAAMSLEAGPGATPDASMETASAVKTPRGFISFSQTQLSYSDEDSSSRSAWTRPLWVQFGSPGAQLGSPLYPQEQTSQAGAVRSEKCQRSG